MAFEVLLLAAGGFGLYQKLLCFLLIPLTTGLCGLVYYAQVFALYVPRHWCEDDTSWYNNTLDDATMCASYRNSSCRQWAFNYNYSYPNIATQNSWVCEEAWKGYSIQTFFWTGNTIGVWLWGVMADNVGRKPTILACAAVYLFSGVASIYIEDYYGFAFLRFIVGLSHVTISHLPYVLVIEYCGSSTRYIPLITIMASYTIGSIIAPLLANLIWQWQWMLLVAHFPAIIVLLSWKILPESLSWLMAKGKAEEAKKLLKLVAALNKSRIEEGLLEENMTKDVAEPGKHYSVVELFKYPNLRRNSVIIIIIWMISCLSFYGHSLNTANLSEDIYLSFILGAALEIPAWIAPFLINYLGRKWPMNVSYSIASVLSLLFVFLTFTGSDNTVVTLGIALASRAIMTSAYYITLQYCPEVFPTVVRGQGVALAETVAGIAIFVSPFVVYLAEYGRAYPLLCLGCLGVLGSVLTVFLPETANQSLPQSIKDGENFGQDQKLIDCSCFQNKRNEAEDPTIDHYETAI